MEIKILGGGCPKCERLESVTREVIQELDVEAEIIKVKSLAEIMTYDVISTPALVVDETVVSSGRIPDREEIKIWLKNTSG